MSTFVTLTFLCPLLADNLSEDHVEQTPIFFGEWEASWQTPGVRASSLLVIFLCPFLASFALVVSIPFFLSLIRVLKCLVTTAYGRDHGC